MLLSRIKSLFSGYLIFFYFFFLVLTIFVSKNAFFWDSIQLASRHAHFFFENKLKIALLPDNIDSGHIPAFGYLLALFWKVFGYSLTVSHFLMLPFLLGIVFQAYLLTSYFFPERGKYLVLLLLLVDPTYLAQTVLVSPDIPLVFFFFYLLNGILKQNNAIKIIAVLGLSLVSMRGWMTALTLFFFDLLSDKELRAIRIKYVWEKLWPYLPGGLLTISFLAWHYLAKGWIGYHPDSPWADCFERVSFEGFLFNVGIYIWRLIDFGRIVWFMALLITLKWAIKNLKTDVKLRKLLLLVILFLVVYPFSLLLYKQLLQHRYLLPVFFSIALLVSYILIQNRKQVMAFVVLVALLAGNFIIYPDKVAQGWDASLAHLPYYKLHDEAVEFMKDEGIDIESTKSWFPNLSSNKYTHLEEESYRFLNAPIDSCTYVLYSNIFNDISDKEYNQLQQKWELIYAQKQMGVTMNIFKNPISRP